MQLNTTAENGAQPSAGTLADNARKATRKLARLTATPAAGFTVDGFAAAICFHPESVRRCIRKGQINALRFGREWRIPPAEAARIFANGLPS